MGNKGFRSLPLARRLPGDPNACALPANSEVLNQLDSKPLFS
jgi:hypothetical protein